MRRLALADIVPIGKALDIFLLDSPQTSFPALECTPLSLVKRSVKRKIVSDRVSPPWCILLVVRICHRDILIYLVKRQLTVLRRKDSLTNKSSVGP